MRAYLRRRRQEFLEAWANGSFIAESGDGTIQLNAKALGKVGAIDEVLDIDADFIISELRKEKQ